MIHTLTTRMISISLLVLGGMFCYVPTQLQECFTQYVYDGLAPGMNYLRPYLNKAPHILPAEGKLPTEVLRQCSLLWAENNRLRNIELEMKNSPLRNLPVRELSPLVSAEIIPAKILSVSQASRWQQELILQTPKQQGITKGDFVVSQTELLIDQGELAGVSPEALLLTGSVVVGQITQVGLQTAKVKRLVDPEFRGAAMLLRQSAHGPVWGAMGSLQGTGENFCKLDYIKLTDPVAEGDYVVAINPETKQYLGPVYGKVSKITQEAGKTDWQIVVTPLSSENSWALSTVHVLAEKLHTSRVLQVSHEELLEPVSAEKKYDRAPLPYPLAVDEEARIKIPEDTP